MLLWSLNETAQQLGGISIRSVRRMVERGELSLVRVGRLVKIVPESVYAFVESRAVPAHNLDCVGSVAWKGNEPCYTNAKAHRTGMQTTPTHPAKELDALLAQLTKRKQKH
jgi:excisionase family DNA binding protein